MWEREVNRDGAWIKKGQYTWIRVVETESWENGEDEIKIWETKIFQNWKIYVLRSNKIWKVMVKIAESY